MPEDGASCTPGVPSSLMQPLPNLPRADRATIPAAAGADKHDATTRVRVAGSMEPRQQLDIPDPSLGRTGAGWYPDPWNEAPWRWWDGSRWTGYVAAGGAPARGWIPPGGGRDHALRGGAIAAIGFAIAEGFSLGFVGLVTLLGGSVGSLAALCAGQAGLWTALFLSCRVAVRRHGTGSLRDLGLVRLSLRDVGSAAIAALVARIAAGIVTVALLLLFHEEPVRRATSISTRLDAGPIEVVVLVAIIVVGAPYFEELFFRGLVQGTLSSRLGSRAAIAIQAGCFGLVHLQLGMTTAQAVITLTTITLVGLLLGILRWHYEQLGVCMVAHGLFNAVAVVVIFSV